jgi:drug/metabolite transporter (DMT)-like permease
VSLAAILLILTAAIIHVGWNTVGKKRQPNLAFFAIAIICSAFLMAPILIWNRALWAEMPSQVGFLLVVAGFWQALYIGSLGYAYKHGHLSIAYPLARALPVLFVTMVSAFRSEVPLTPALYLGGALIIVGALLLPLPHFRDWDWHHYRNLSCLFALFAAIGTAGYSMTDDYALGIFRNAASDNFTPLNVTPFYMCLESISSGLWLLPALLLNKQNRQDAREIFRSDLKTVAATAPFMAVGYLLILLSMAYVEDVSYVVAFRQASIPLGAIVGIVFLKEPAQGPKIVGVGLMFVGLVLTALG